MRPAGASVAFQRLSIDGDHHLGVRVAARITVTVEEGRGQPDQRIGAGGLVLRWWLLVASPRGRILVLGARGRLLGGRGVGQLEQIGFGVFGRDPGERAGDPDLLTRGMRTELALPGSHHPTRQSTAHTWRRFPPSRTTVSRDSSPYEIDERRASIGCQDEQGCDRVVPA
jgi:hypothetical protein